MHSRIHLALVLVSTLLSTGASFRTANFVVEAPTQEVAQQIGQAAEHYRKEKAIEWLGQEMPAWPSPCPLRVKVTLSGAGGATTFSFEPNRIQQHMEIEGPLDRLLASVLPHEVTHTVFAHYFRHPVPRWADEGGAVLSEDDIERNRHDMLVRQILNTPGRAMPLRRLFALREYPGDVMTLYAQGFSVSQYLVERSNRQAFLAFVKAGVQEGWDRACQTHYRYQNVEELEQAWLAHLRATKRGQQQQLARNTNNDNSGKLMVRQTVPPAQPLLSNPQPIVRAQAPQDGDECLDSRRGMAARPGYLPEFQSPAPSAQHSAVPRGQDGWSPAGQITPQVPRPRMPGYSANPPAQQYLPTVQQPPSAQHPIVRLGPPSIP